MGESLGTLGINPLFLLSQIVNFLILFIVLRVVLWKPLLQRLDQRREMLHQQQQDAEAVAKAREEIDQEKTRILEAAHAEANQILTEARRKAREIIEEANDRGRQEAEEFIERARQEAEEERNLLLGRMREQIASLAIAAANQLVGEAMDEQRQRALVASFFSGIREGRVQVLPEDLGKVKGPVIVTSAIPLNEGEKETLRQDLTDRLGRDVQVSFQVDPKILGGLVVRIGDRIIDGGLAGQLEQLREELT